MTRPDKKTREALDAADWDDIAPKLLHYALYLMKKKTVKRLPDGMTAEDVVVLAIQKVYSEGGRSWNPEKVPDLLYYLKRVLDSDLSGNGLLDPRKLKGEPEYKDDEELLEDLRDTPIQEEDDFCDESFTNSLYQEIAGDEELELIVAALELDITRRSDIAEETGLAVKIIDVARRRLERKAIKARQRLQEMAGEIK